ncbi:hypothetical protein TGAMA5MH_10726 [Trichoderma gamsii]|uniref:Uncharacterized protein n=1 Tax=Trichoderma gamsii TaxID=398673 RepID=A0A2K0SVP0_9HYPO|nr:hypothetical protein TGAMA5MH_10726 [Trichoderma gamsii]
MAKTNPTSLDGRSQKLSKPAWKPKEQPGPSLRPASPPKHNPWRQRQASIVSDQERPVKPLELKAEEFPVLNNPEKGDKAEEEDKENKEDQQEKQGKQDKQEQTAETISSEQPNPPEPCDASSKASSTTNETQSEGARSPLSRLSTPTRLILEEAADQAAQMMGPQSRCICPMPSEQCSLAFTSYTPRISTSAREIQYSRSTFYMFRDVFWPTALP